MVRKWQWTKWQRWAVMGAVLMSSGTALAVDPAVKCEAEKLKAAGKYAFCRMHAEAKASAKFEAPDFSKCDAAFDQKWQQAESRAVAKGTSCWTMGDATTIQGATADYTDSVADSLDP
jgi:hypothetical protein